MWFIWPCLKSTGDIQNLMLVEMSFHKDFDFEVIGVFFDKPIFELESFHVHPTKSELGE